VPDVGGGYYNVQVCNDPCTVSGFREPLSAYISIVGTAREGELLNENDRLYRIAASARREARHAVNENEELTLSLEQSRSDVLELSAEVSRLERELAASRTVAPPSSTTTTEAGRPLVEAWALFGIAIAVVLALAAFAVAIVLARRPAPRIVIPDTIAELDIEAEHAVGVR
jgi:hypothetical protein